MSSKAEKERAEKEHRETKESLPINHPKAGYVSPDLSFIDDRDPPVEEHVERLKIGEPVVRASEVEVATREENIKKHKEEVEKIAEAEDKVRKEERQAQEKADQEALDRAREAERARTRVAEVSAR